MTFTTILLIIIFIIINKNLILNIIKSYKEIKEIEKLEDKDLNKRINLYMNTYDKYSEFINKN